MVWLLLQLTTLTPFPHCSVSLQICADSLKAGNTTEKLHCPFQAKLSQHSTCHLASKQGAQQQKYKMISMQMSTGTSVLWPVPAAVKNSWGAEDSNRAVNVITAVSAGALLCWVEKTCTVSLLQRFRQCVKPKCTAVSRWNCFSFLCLLRQAYLNDCYSIQLLKLNHLLKPEGQKCA